MPIRATLEKLRRAHQTGEHVTIVAFGDSNTEPTWHTQGRKNWVELLAEALVEAHGNGVCTVINSGKCGGSYSEGLTRLDRAVLHHAPDLVLLAFGMNDATRGEAGLPAFREAMRATIRRIRASGTADIVVRTSNPVVAVHGVPLPPDTRPGTEWRDAARPLHLYAAATAEVAAAEGCALVDHYRLWTERVFTYGHPVVDPTALWVRMGDAIHPNALGHLVFYRELAPLFDLPTYFPWEDAPADPRAHRHTVPSKGNTE